jgi:hypothetical protein
VYYKLSQIANCYDAVNNPKSVNLIAKSRLKHHRDDAKGLGELLGSNYLADEKTREEMFLVSDRVK